MLKDITLGQFFPGDTFIHRLDPRTKILAVVLYIVALFNAKWLVSYGVVAAVLLACILVSKVHFSATDDVAIFSARPAQRAPRAA